ILDLPSMPPMKPIIPILDFGFWLFTSLDGRILDLRLGASRKSKIQNLKSKIALAALLLAGVTLSVFNVPLASSATNSVDVTHIGQAVPTDPQSSLWAQA